MTGTHSKTGASSMHRWAACPGSVRMSAGVESRASSYAEEGTDAHALAACCLDQGHSAGVYTGKAHVLGGRKVTVTQEMAEAVQVYIDFIGHLITDKSVVEIEQKFDLSDVHPGCYGTADAVVWLPDEQLLVVVDFKYGAGIPVSPKDNPQLMYYGLGALLASGYPAKRVRLVIVQPRCGDGEPSCWDIDSIELLEFCGDLKRYAMATEDPNAPLVPGDHCRFCPAAGTCPALQSRALEAAKMEFKPLVPYDPADLKLALDSREIVRAWLKTIDEFAYAEAEAGRVPPGYKLVEKKANRKWRDEGEAIETLQMMAEDGVIFEPRALKSPAQLEKAIGKDGIAAIASLIVKESSGHALVPESDKRPAIVPSTPQDDFAIVGGDPLNIPKAFQRAPKPETSYFD